MRLPLPPAATFALLALCLVVAPFLLYPIFVMKLLCFALFAASINLLLGFGGLLSFGHAAYFGLAAYITAWGIKEGGLTPATALLTSVTAAMLLGAVFGAIAIRRQGIYFAMITLAMAQIVYFFCVRFPEFTGGENGLSGVPRGKILGLLDLSDDRVLYVTVAVIFLGLTALIHRIVHSPYGRTLMAIRDSENRAISLGYDVQRFKLLAFVLSTGIAGAAGSLKAMVFQMASLTDVHWAMSGEAVLMALIGGLGTLTGPLIGAAVVVATQNYLAHLGAVVTMVQGLIFVLSVLLFREGIAGLLNRLSRRYRAKTQLKPAQGRASAAQRS